MARPVSRKPDAIRDLTDLAEYISRDSLDAALRFLDAAEQTFDFLSEHREVGQFCSFQSPEAVGMRMWPVDGFRNHLVFYRAAETGVEIVRVLQGARDLEALFGEHD